MRHSVIGQQVLTLLQWIYSSEISTQRLRGLIVSYAAATQWVFNLAVARATPVMLQTVGAHGYGTYFIYGCFCFTIGVGAIFFVPETKGVSYSPR